MLAILVRLMNQNWSVNRNKMEREDSVEMIERYADIAITRSQACVAQVEWRTRPLEKITSRNDTAGIKRITFVLKNARIIMSHIREFQLGRN